MRYMAFYGTIPGQSSWLIDCSPRDSFFAIFIVSVLILVGSRMRIAMRAIVSSLLSSFILVVLFVLFVLGFPRPCSAEHSGKDDRKLRNNST